MMKKLLTILLSMAMVLCMMPSLAWAETPEEGQNTENATIDIYTDADLIAAIHGQADGQTWNIHPKSDGTMYDVGDECVDVEANINNVEKGFIFPIFVDNLTITAEEGANVTITSSHDPDSGVWCKEDFITVNGKNVTFEGINLKGNYNSYYDSCNKVMELIDGGQNLTLKNVKLLPVESKEEDKAGKVFSGSIYVNVANPGTTTFENVEMNSWISARTATSGEIIVKNVAQDFTNNYYAGYSYPGYGYAWNPGISSDTKGVVQIDGFTIKVDSNSNFVKQILKELKPGTTIELTEDITVDEMLYINGVDNVTIKGNGHTITAADAYSVNSVHGQSNLMKIENSDNVVLDNVKLVATEKNKHTLDVYTAENLVLNDVTLNHENASDGAPLVNNGSTISVTGDLELVTGEHSWYGVNVDNKNGDATLTFEKDSTLKFDDKSNLETPKEIFYLEKGNSSEGVKEPTVESDSQYVDIGEVKIDEKGNLVPHIHIYELVGVKEASCTETGYTGDLKCDCGHIKTPGTVIPKLAHHYVNGVCEDCGKIKPYIPPVDTLATDRNTAVKAVEDSVVLTNYDAAEQAVIAEIIDQAKKDIAAAKTKDEIKAIEEAAKAELEKVLTTIEKEIAKVKGMKLAARSLATKAPSGKKAIRIQWYESKDGSLTKLDKGFFDKVEIYRATKKGAFGTKPIYTSKSDRYYNTSIKKGKRYYYSVVGVKTIGDEEVRTEMSLMAIRTAK